MVIHGDFGEYMGVLGSIVMGRRKFRSQISDNEDESEKRNKMQVREKVQKSKNSVFSDVLWLRGFEKSAR